MGIEMLYLSKRAADLDIRLPLFEAVPRSNRQRERSSHSSRLHRPGYRRPAVRGHPNGRANSFASRLEAGREH